MRRKDKQIEDVQIIESILNDANTCRIALSDNNMPYIVPMNFGYKHNKIYLHSAKEGKKIDILKENNNVCFEASTKEELVKADMACHFGMKYLSVIGFGKAHFVDDTDEKINALNIIMSKYWDKSSVEYSKDEVDKLMIIRIDIESMTGKKSGY